MRRLIPLLLVLFGITGVALSVSAQDTGSGSEKASSAAAPMDAMFGNTVKVTRGEEVILIYFNPDKTFIARGGPNGDEFGIWRVEGDKICTKTKLKDGGYSPESCGVIEPNRKVGDSWEAQLEGQAVTVEIVAGR